MPQAIPEVSGMRQVVWHPGDQAELVIPANRAMEENKVQLSQNQKLRIAYKGSVEKPSEFQSAREYQEVVVDADLADELGLDATYIGKTIKVSVDKENFTQPIADDTPNEMIYDNSLAGSSSSANSDNEKIHPEKAFVDDKNQPVYIDLPGKTGGPVMNEDNYLTYSGAGKDIPGDL